jgi:hypothetical protein
LKRANTLAYFPEDSVTEKKRFYHIHTRGIQ